MPELNKQLSVAFLAYAKQITEQLGRALTSEEATMLHAAWLAGLSYSIQIANNHLKTLLNPEPQDFWGRMKKAMKIKD